MNTETMRLVEQARELLRDELWMHSNDEQDAVVAGLADAVEILSNELRESRADSRRLVVRVAALEATLRDAERTLELYDRELGWDNAKVELQAIRAILGRSPYTRQET